MAATPKGQQNKRGSLEGNRLLCNTSSAAAEEHIIMAVPRPAPSHFAHLFLRRALWSRPINLHLLR